MDPREATWESERLYLSGDSFYAALISEIESSEYSVDMEVYTFEAGVLAERLCDCFKRAYLRGVRVRLIFDHWGSSGLDLHLYRRLLDSGVRMCIFRGLPWKVVGGEQTGRMRGEGNWVRHFLKRITNLNRGFHRKVTIVDNTSAWVSSLNVSDVHLKEVHGKAAWADAGLRVSGPEVRFLSNAFKRVFGERVTADRKVVPCLVALNDTRFLRGWMSRRFRQRIESAHTRVWIQTPYFLPPRRLLRALCSSARKGVDVRILIPVKNDYQFVRWMSLGVMGILLNSGVRVLENQGAFAHKKILIVDGVVLLGSINFNYRSFLHDLEVEITVTDPSCRAQLESSIRYDEASSQELTLAKLKSLPLWLRMVSRLLFFFRYWC